MVLDLCLFSHLQALFKAIGYAVRECVILGLLQIDVHIRPLTKQLLSKKSWGLWRVCIFANLDLGRGFGSLALAEITIVVSETFLVFFKNCQDESCRYRNAAEHPQP